MTSRGEKPVNAQEAWDSIKTRIAPRYRSLLEDMIGSGRVTLDETVKPDAIVGERWPGCVIGSMRVDCADCGTHLAISPASGMVTLKRFPGTPVICLACAVKRDEAEQ